MFGLVPGQPAIAFGAELTAVGCLTVVITAVIQWRAPKSSYERMSLRVLASQSPAVLWVVAGVVFAAWQPLWPVPQSGRDHRRIRQRRAEQLGAAGGNPALRRGRPG